MYQGEWVLSSIIEDGAERYGDKLAVESAAGKMSYHELRDRVARVARGLAGLGVRPGDTVATMLDSNVDYVLAWFGTAWAGAVEVPINNELKGVLLEHIVRESSASVIFIAARWVDRLTGLDLPELRHVIVVGADQDPAPAAGTRPASSFAHVAACEPLPRVPRDERDLAYILYTSGTTGSAKGAMHCGRSALWTAQVWIDMMNLTSDDVGYSMLPLFHVTARTATTTATFMSGGSVALRERFSVKSFWADARAAGATNFMYMGAVIHLLGAAPPGPGDRDHRLRVAGGAAAPPKLAAQFRERFGVDLIEVFGMTEIGTVTGGQVGVTTPGTMGKPFAHVQMEIHDENDAPVPPDEPGEIVVRPSVPEAIFSGYWRNSQYTVQAWRNLWFHTGDRGKMNAQGELTFVDRIKDSLRRRGENISSFEVERLINAHPQVLESAAYAVASDMTEDDVMVAVVPRDGEAIDARELFEFCVATMPRYTVPNYIRFVAQLPKTPTARVQKFVLRDEGLTEDTFKLSDFGIVVPRS